MKGWLLGLSPIAPAEFHRRVLAEVARLKRRTGVDFLGSVTALAIALVPPPPPPGTEDHSGRSVFVGALQLNVDPNDWIKAIKDDPELGKTVREDASGEITVVTVGSVELGLPPQKNVLLIGAQGALSGAIARGQLPGAQGVAMFPPHSEGAVLRVWMRPNPTWTASIEHLVGGPGAIEGWMGAPVGLTLAVTADSVHLALELSARDTAQAFAAKLSGLLKVAHGKLADTFGGSLTGGGEGGSAPPASLATLLHIPSVIGTSTIRSIIEGTTVMADGPVIRAEIARSRLPALDTQGSTIVLAGLFAGMLSDVLRARAAHEQEECFVIQEKLRGAWELYSKDIGSHPRLEDVADELVSRGYLDAKPDDPGQGPGTFGHYFSRPDGSVGCRVHGQPAWELPVPSQATSISSPTTEHTTSAAPESPQAPDESPDSGDDSPE